MDSYFWQIVGASSKSWSRGTLRLMFGCNILMVLVGSNQLYMTLLWLRSWWCLLVLHMSHSVRIYFDNHSEWIVIPFRWSSVLTVQHVRGYKFFPFTTNIITDHSVTKSCLAFVVCWVSKFSCCMLVLSPCYRAMSTIHWFPFFMDNTVPERAVNIFYECMDRSLLEKMSS